MGGNTTIDNPLLWCPDWTCLHDWLGCYAMRPFATGTGRYYGVQDFEPGYPATGQLVGLRMTRIAKPSQTIVFADPMLAHTGMFGANKVDMHGWRFNFVCLDGHGGQAKDDGKIMAKMLSVGDPLSGWSGHSLNVFRALEAINGFDSGW